MATKAEVPLATHPLAYFAADLTFDKLPTEVVRQTKKTLLDNVGVILSVARTSQAQEVAGMIRDAGERPEATVAGMGFKSSARQAAFYAAVTMQISNGMSGYSSALMPPFHPAEIPVPVALALGESLQVSGKQLIEALAAGLECGIRIALGTQPAGQYRGFHSCDTIGCLASTIVAGKLLGLDREQIINALGIATMITPLAIQSNKVEGLVPEDDHTVLPLSPGQSASAAMLAAHAVKRGLKGQRYGLDGKYGFCHVIAGDEANYHAIGEGLGQEFKAARVYHKRFCSCRWFQGAMDLTLDLVTTHQLKPEDIERMQVRTVWWTASRNLATSTSSTTQECFSGSVSYAAAFTAVHPDQVTSPLLYADTTHPRRFPEVHEFRKRVEVLEDPEFSKAHPGKIPTAVEIRTRDGKTYSAHADYIRGDEPEVPLTKEELDNKFHRFAGEVLDEAKANEIRSMIYELENVENVARLSSLLAP